MAQSAEKTSSGLLALVVSALSECAPDMIPPGLAMPDCALAHAPAAPKRALLAAAIERFGPGFVLGMGQRVRRMGFEPVLHVLLRSESPEILAAKWRHFEQFTHSSHRTDAVASERRLVLTRYGRTRPRPTLGENLLVYGLLIALLEEIGCEGISAELVARGREPVPVIERGEMHLTDACSIDVSNRLVLSWQRFERHLRADPPELNNNGPSRAPLLFYGGNEGARYARHVAARLTGDIGRSWTLGDFAGDLRVSGRTLQRRLAEEGTSLTEMLKAVRIREACHLLTGSGLSLTEIGYWCGYSDGPHFSREFRRALGMPPAAYRRAAA